MSVTIGGQRYHAQAKDWGAVASGETKPESTVSREEVNTRVKVNVGQLFATVERFHSARPSDSSALALRALANCKDVFDLRHPVIETDTAAHTGVPTKTPTASIPRPQ